MREIKFRAMERDLAHEQFPHLHDKRVFGFCYGTGFYDDGVNVWLILENTDKKTFHEMCQVIIDPCTIGQSTGLKDKYGVEIYEGDIVEIPDHWDSTMPLVEVVKYIEATFMPFSDSDWGCDSDECKVIGNVHEHSNLLEV